MGGILTGNLVEDDMMTVRRNVWVGASLAIATLLAGAQSVQAQTANDEVLLRQRLAEYPTVQDEIVDTFFGRTGDFYRNRGVLSTVTTLIGPFPENGIMRDAQAVNELYEELLAIQNTSDPTLRTVDLDNPFDTSLRLLPPYEPPVPGPRPPFIPAIQPTPPPPPAQPQGPVRGLY